MTGKTRRREEECRIYCLLYMCSCDYLSLEAADNILSRPLFSLFFLTSTFYPYQPRIPRDLSRTPASAFLVSVAQSSEDEVYAHLRAPPCPPPLGAAVGRQRLVRNDKKKNGASRVGRLSLKVLPCMVILMTRKKGLNLFSY